MNTGCRVRREADKDSAGSEEKGLTEMKALDSNSANPGGVAGASFLIASFRFFLHQNYQELIENQSTDSRLTSSQWSD